MIGLGLLEAVPEDRHPRQRRSRRRQQRRHLRQAEPGVVAASNKRLTLGRFGWKAERADHRRADRRSRQWRYRSLDHDRFPLRPATAPRSRRTASTRRTATQPQYQNVELGDDLFKLIVFYSHNLAVPPRRKPDDPEVLKGKALFAAIGCASCHTPKFTTGEAPDQPHLSQPNDLALHRPSAARHGRGPRRQPPGWGRQRGANGARSPLWGIGLTETVNGHTLFLHDGRARNLKEAILWHGGEAKASRDAFAKLSKAGPGAADRFREFAMSSCSQRTVVGRLLFALSVGRAL